EIAGHEHLVLADLQNDAVVDLLPSRQDLDRWIGSREGVPDLAVIGVDPQLARSLREACPEVDIAIPISESRAAIVAAAERTMKSLARDERDAGRNFRERPELLTRPDEELTADERDELSLWSRSSVALRRCVTGLVGALDEAVE